MADNMEPRGVLSQLTQGFSAPLERMGARMDALVARRRQLEGAFDTLAVELLAVPVGSWDWLVGHSCMVRIGQEMSDLGQEFEPLVATFNAELDRLAIEAGHTGGENNG